MATSTLDVWRKYSADFQTQQAVAGIHGIDFRVPQPSIPQRRILRMLEAVAEMEPRMINNSAAMFDWSQEFSVSLLLRTPFA